jgi:hypothetical protein
VGLAHFTLHSELDIEHGSSIHDLIRKWAVTDDRQNGVRQAVHFKRAFIQMEDRCARIACRIDPQLFAQQVAEERFGMLRGPQHERKILE